MKSAVILLVVIGYVSSVEQQEDKRLLFKSLYSPLLRNRFSDHKSLGRHFFTAEVKDIGYATNCGDPKHNFTLSWQPKVIRPSQGVNLHLTMVSAIDMASGVATASVATAGSPPFIEESMPFDCKAIKKVFPKMKCPVSKNDKIDVSFMQSDLTALPQGSYELKVDVKNDKKESFICAKLNVMVKE